MGGGGERERERERERRKAQAQREGPYKKIIGNWYSFTVLKHVLLYL